MLVPDTAHLTLASSRSTKMTSASFWRPYARGGRSLLNVSRRFASIHTGAAYTHTHYAMFHFQPFTVWTALPSEPSAEAAHEVHPTSRHRPPAMCSEYCTEDGRRLRASSGLVVCDVGCFDNKHVKNRQRLRRFRCRCESRKVSPERGGDLGCGVDA